MPYEETAYTTKETPRFSLPRWVQARFQPSAIGAGVFALLVVCLVVWGLLDTRTPGPIAAEARQEAWKFLHPWIARCGGFHYIAFSEDKTSPTLAALHRTIKRVRSPGERCSAIHGRPGVEWRRYGARAGSARVFL